MFCENCNRAEHGINVIPDLNFEGYENPVECYCRCHWREWHVNVYELDRHYGGPEEGGWWYDSGEPILSAPFSNEKEAAAYQESLYEKYPRTHKSSSVIYSGGDYAVWIEDQFAVRFPEETPHYE